MKKDLSGIIVIAGVGVLAYLFMQQSAQGQTSGGGSIPTTPWYSILTGETAQAQAQQEPAGTPLSVTIYPANVSFPEMPAFSFFQDNGAGGGQGTPTPKKESQQAAAMAGLQTYLTTPGPQQNAAMTALQTYLGVPVTGASGGASGGGSVPSSKKEVYSTTAGTPAGAVLHAAAAHYGATENKTPSWSGE